MLYQTILPLITSASLHLQTLVKWIAGRQVPSVLRFWTIFTRLISVLQVGQIILPSLDNSCATFALKLLTLPMSISSLLCSFYIHACARIDFDLVALFNEKGHHYT